MPAFDGPAAGRRRIADLNCELSRTGHAALGCRFRTSLDRHGALVETSVPPFPLQREFDAIGLRPYPPSLTKPVLVVYPTPWDKKNLRRPRAAWRKPYRIFFEEDDEEFDWDHDVLAFVEAMVAAYRGRVDGVTSTSDYPGAAVAAAIASRLHLPASRPERVIRASHKYYSRLLQREAAPEAVPTFALIDPERPDPADVPFPCFVKPVKGAFSIMAARVDSPAELVAFFDLPAAREFLRDYVLMFNALVRRFTDFDVDGRAFLAEEYLQGRQATVEGYVQGGRVEIFGIVDSHFRPGTHSFVRFTTPSTLPDGVQDRMADFARRVVGRLELDNTLFNIEMNFNPEADAIGIVEVNPRMAGQFADLHEAVDGRNSYEIALALAVGRRVNPLKRRGAFRAAASVPLRAFEPVRVARAPVRREAEQIEAEFPHARIWVQCRTGQELADFARQGDGWSIRYAVINAAGEDGREVEETVRRIVRRLDFRFKPLR